MFNSYICIITGEKMKTEKEMWQEELEHAMRETESIGKWKEQFIDTEYVKLKKKVKKAEKLLKYISLVQQEKKDELFCLKVELAKYIKNEKKEPV